LKTPLQFKWSPSLALKDGGDSAPAGIRAGSLHTTHAATLPQHMFTSPSPEVNIYMSCEVSRSSPSPNCVPAKVE